MKFCPNCGQQAAVETARFCRACGAALPQPTPAGAGTPPPVPSPSAETPPPAPPKMPSAPPPASVATPSASVSDEHEIPPPPPGKGISVTWQKEKRGLSRRPDDQPPEIAVTAGTRPVTAAAASANSTATSAPGGSSASGAAASSASAAPAGAAAATSFKNMVGASDPVALPPAPATWKFREQTGAWADQLAGKLRGALASSNPSFGAALTRTVRGAMMHREIYRQAAANPQLNTEALYLAGAIILAGFIGLWFTGFSFFYSGGGIGMFIRLAVMRIATWAAAIFAIQYAAKSLHQVNLPAAAWFRALVYAQAASLLMIIPAVGVFSGFLSAVCSIAAIHDVEGRDTVSAVIVGVIGAVAATIATYFATAVMRSFF